MNIKEEAMILRRTHGLCPICRRKVEAEVLAGADAVCLSKHCPEHGKMQDPLAKGYLYRDLEKYYFSLMSVREKRKEGAAELLVTFKCNMECRVCYLGDFKRQLAGFEPTLEEIENTVKLSKDRIFVISGGEATCRNDLFDIIRILKKYKKVVGLNTNGIKLSDLEYVRQLKDAGIDEVGLQFSGFDPKAEEYLRGKDYISFKTNALENLKQAGIPTRINMLVARGINDDQVGAIINYVMHSGFIKMVNFGSLLFIGNAINFPKEHYMMPDDMLQIAQEQTGNKIKREHAYLLKKLELALSSFMNKSACLYSLATLVIRRGDAYETIDTLLDLEGIEPYLEKYRIIYLRNRLWARAYLALMALPILLFHTKFSFVMSELIIAAASFLFRMNYFSKSGRFVYLLFTVECDPYRMDFDMHRNCPRKSVLFFDRVNSRFVRLQKAIESSKWLLWD